MANSTSIMDKVAIGEYLAAGSFGLVFKAINKDNSAPTTVIKISFLENDPHPTNRQGMERDRERMEREYNLLHGKEHPNIVKIFEFEERALKPRDIKDLVKLIGIDEIQDRIARFQIRAERLGSISALYFYMELCGKNLRDWLNSPHSSARNELAQQQYEIVQNIVDGLKFLHDDKIVHRDLKPENIMFTNGFNLPVKIGDFGLCRNVHNNESMTNTLTAGPGTKSYRAPEMETEEYGLQADLYALGLIIFEVIQLIEKNERNKLFHKLLDDEDYNVVKYHPVIRNAKELITNLTKRKVAERLKTIHEVKILRPAIGCTLLCGRQVKVINSAQFENCLQTCGDGCHIELAAGTFHVAFECRWNDVKITGRGDATVIKHIKSNRDQNVVMIAGMRCELSSIKLAATDHSRFSVNGEGYNILTNITFEGCGLDVRSSHNTINNLKFTNGEKAIRLLENENEIKDVNILCCLVGVRIRSSNNHVERINCVSVRRPISCVGCNNKIKDVKCIGTVNVPIAYLGPISWKFSLGSLTQYEQPQFSEAFIGVHLLHDSAGNEVLNVKIIGDFWPTNSWGLRIEGSNAEIRNCEVTNVLVDGHHHHIYDVRAPGLIQVQGNGHTFTNCTTTKLHSMGSNITYTNCKL